MPAECETRGRDARFEGASVIDSIDVSTGAVRLFQAFSAGLTRRLRPRRDDPRASIEQRPARSRAPPRRPIPERRPAGLQGLPARTRASVTRTPLRTRAVLDLPPWRPPLR